MQAQLGMTLHAGDLDMPDLIRYVQEAESLGYEGFWLTEESGKEAFSVLALAAQATERIRLATGIVNFYSRTPTLLAMAASTLYRLSQGRFALGLGTGGIGFMLRGHGLQIERPLARARETFAIVRGLLYEKRFSYDGEWFHVRDFHLREGPIDGRLPLYLAALNPQMVRLAARISDGLITNWLTEESLEELQSQVRQEAQAAGRDPQEVKILTLLMTCVDSEDEEALDAMRRGLAFYFASPHYHHIAEISGYKEEAVRIKELWDTGDFKGASRLVTGRMMAKFSLTGPEDACREKLKWMLEEKVYPIIYPLPRPDRQVDDHFETIRLAARYVA